MDKVRAPWTEDQVKLLGARQANPQMHPYTCPKCGQILEVEEKGWYCSGFTDDGSDCGHEQNWCLATDLGLYPCRDCGKLRTKDQGGTVFAVCDDCWDAIYGKGIGGSFYEVEGQELFYEEQALGLMLRNGVIYTGILEDGPGESGPIALYVLCNDLFAWACSDQEVLPFDQVENLYRMYRADPRWGPQKWCCVQRKSQPQHPVVESMKEEGAWDEVMESLPVNTMDAEVHRIVGCPLPDYLKESEGEEPV